MVVAWLISSQLLPARCLVVCLSVSLCSLPGRFPLSLLLVAWSFSSQLLLARCFVVFLSASSYSLLGRFFHSFFSLVVWSFSFQFLFVRCYVVFRSASCSFSSQLLCSLLGGFPLTFQNSWESTSVSVGAVSSFINISDPMTFHCSECHSN